jgi:hypothetical protein
MPSTTSRAAATLLAVTQGASACYVGFSTTVINADGSGITEPSGNAYARISVAAAEWTTVGRRRSTNVAKAFSAAPTGSWGTLIYWFISTAASGGTIEWYDPLSLSIVPSIGTAPSIPAGQLFIQVD